ncbi:MAG: 28S ribosomal protein S5, mitochondrial [Watsoniomyces obsoletus]|nr:MAG: 28S ribosomal protein S5, mitochondrial [Watsoniomyces obsoletus]
MAPIRGQGPEGVEPRTYTIDDLKTLGDTLPYLKCDISKFSGDAWRAQLIKHPNSTNEGIVFPADFPSTWSRKVKNFTRARRDTMENIKSRVNEEPRGRLGERRSRAKPLRPLSIDIPPPRCHSGFERFLETIPSPTHQRVTAGGRVVPAQPGSVSPVAANRKPLISPVTSTAPQTSPVLLPAMPGLGSVMYQPIGTIYSPPGSHQPMLIDIGPGYSPAMLSPVLPHDQAYFHPGGPYASNVAQHGGVPLQDFTNGQRTSMDQMYSYPEGQEPYMPATSTSATPRLPGLQWQVPSYLAATRRDFSERDIDRARFLEEQSEQARLRRVRGKAKEAVVLPPPSQNWWGAEWAAQGTTLLSNVPPLYPTQPYNPYAGMGPSTSLPPQRAPSDEAWPTKSKEGESEIQEPSCEAHPTEQEDGMSVGGAGEGSVIFSPRDDARTVSCPTATAEADDEDDQEPVVGGPPPLGSTKGIRRTSSAPFKFNAAAPEWFSTPRATAANERIMAEPASAKSPNTHGEQNGTTEDDDPPSLGALADVANLSIVGTRAQEDDATDSTIDQAERVDSIERDTLESSGEQDGAPATPTKKDIHAHPGIVSTIDHAVVETQEPSPEELAAPKGRPLTPDLMDINASPSRFAASQNTTPCGGDSGAESHLRRLQSQRKGDGVMPLNDSTGNENQGSPQRRSRRKSFLRTLLKDPRYYFGLGNSKENHLASHSDVKEEHHQSDHVSDNVMGKARRTTEKATSFDDMHPGPAGRYHDRFSSDTTTLVEQSPPGMDLRRPMPSDVADLREFGANMESSYAVVEDRLSQAPLNPSRYRDAWTTTTNSLQHRQVLEVAKFRATRPM